jgi:hypothetical protein
VQTPVKLSVKDVNSRAFAVSYHFDMAAAPAPLRVLLTLALTAVCFGQPDGIEIKLPSGVPSETFVIRYFVTGAFGGFNGWVDQRKGLHIYRVNTVHQGQPATQFKAILYAPGCAIQTISMALSETSPRSCEFACHPLPSIPISGKLTRTERLRGETIEIRVNYVAYWARKFFGVSDELVTTIPIAVVTPDANDAFTVTLPDFLHDELASAPDHAGVFQFWARGKTTGNLLAELVPAESKAKFGSLAIKSEYPQELVFTPCAVTRRLEHKGFAKRSDVDLCDR